MFKRQPKSNKLPALGKRSPTTKKGESNNSVIKFLWWNLTFTNEPLWFRLTVIILFLLTTIFLIWALKIWAAPAFALQKLPNLKLPNFLNIFKNR
jgi:hypothetical protein